MTLAARHLSSSGLIELAGALDSTEAVQTVIVGALRNILRSLRLIMAFTALYLPVVLSQDTVLPSDQQSSVTGTFWFFTLTSIELPVGSLPIPNFFLLPVHHGRSTTEQIQEGGARRWNSSATEP
jgi:hypothetical protein